jgi:hypothetical protein
VLALLVTGLLASGPAACSSDDDGPTTTAAASGATTPERDPVWPPSDGDRSYEDPVAAALAFALGYLGMAQPQVGTFTGDDASGEVAVRVGTAGPVTRVLLARDGGGRSWSVTGATSADAQLTSPATGATVVSPVQLSGRTTSDRTLRAELRPEGADAPVAAIDVAATDPDRPGEFSAPLAFTADGVTRGALVLSLRSPDGAVEAASVVGVRIGA